MWVVDKIPHLLFPFSLYGCFDILGTVRFSLSFDEALMEMNLAEGHTVSEMTLAGLDMFHSNLHLMDEEFFWVSVEKKCRSGHCFFLRNKHLVGLYPLVP